MTDLHEINESRMTGKPTRGRRIQMLHDLANDDGCVTLKQGSRGYNDGDTKRM